MECLCGYGEHHEKCAVLSKKMEKTLQADLFRLRTYPPSNFNNFWFQASILLQRSLTVQLFTLSALRQKSFEVAKLRADNLMRGIDDSGRKTPDAYSRLFPEVMRHFEGSHMTNEMP